MRLQYKNGLSARNFENRDSTKINTKTQLQLSSVHFTVLQLNLLYIRLTMKNLIGK